MTNLNTFMQHGKLMTKRHNLSHYDKNDQFRIITEERFNHLLKQLEYGYVRPLLVMGDDGTVVGGNQRLRAYEKLGVDDVWISIIQPEEKIDEQTQEKYFVAKVNGVYASNKEGELKKWNTRDDMMFSFALLDNDNVGHDNEEGIANMLPDYDIDFELFNVDFMGGNSLLDLNAMGTETEVVEDEAPEVDDTPPVSKLGEVYQLGRHRLMCGDSTKIEDVEKLMNGQKADMVFTDPPYGVDYSSRVDKDKRKPWGGIKNDDLEGESLRNFLHDSIAWLDVPKYVCCNWQSVTDFFLALGKPNALIVWDKGSIGLGAGYRNQHEFILFYGKLDHNSESNVWTITRDSTGGYTHPTQKPVAVPSRAIKNLKGNSVLDLFGGSGSTLIACEQLDRTCYMCELDEKYVDVIRKRYWKFVNGSEEGWEKGTPAI